MRGDNAEYLLAFGCKHGDQLLRIRADALDILRDALLVKNVREINVYKLLKRLVASRDYKLLEVYRAVKSAVRVGDENGIDVVILGCFGDQPSHSALDACILADGYKIRAHSAAELVVAVGFEHLDLLLDLVLDKLKHLATSLLIESFKCLKSLVGIHLLNDLSRIVGVHLLKYLARVVKIGENFCHRLVAKHANEPVVLLLGELLKNCGYIVCVVIVKQRAKQLVVAVSLNYGQYG